jgi:hypothetical protein
MAVTRCDGVRSAFGWLWSALDGVKNRGWFWAGLTGFALVGVVRVLSFLSFSFPLLPSFSFLCQGFASRSACLFDVPIVYVKSLF